MRIGDRDGAVKIIRVGGAETGNLAARLRPGGRIFGMRVNHAADFGERFVENKVSWKIGRRSAGHLLQSLPSRSVTTRCSGFILLVGNAAGLDDHQTLVAQDAAGVAEGVKHQPAADQFQIGFENFRAQLRKRSFELFRYRHG